ncbi:hypothetical protein OK016_01295 [Vibrio chagasii]|nr:hypothetical protein [Vibrio chagasii]
MFGPVLPIVPYDSIDEDKLYHNKRTSTCAVPNVITTRKPKTDSYRTLIQAAFVIMTLGTCSSRRRTVWWYWPQAWDITTVLKASRPLAMQTVLTGGKINSYQVDAPLHTTTQSKK